MRIVLRRLSLIHRPTSRAGRARYPGFPTTPARVLLATLALSIALLTVPVPSVPAEAAAPAPAASYRLDAAIDLDRATVAVSEGVQFRNVVGVPLDTLVFRVVPNALGALWRLISCYCPW